MAAAGLRGQGLTLADVGAVLGVCAIETRSVPSLPPTVFLRLAYSVPWPDAKTRRSPTWTSLSVLMTENLVISLACPMPSAG